MNNEITKDSLNIPNDELEKKINEFKSLGLLTNNDYSPEGRYSRNVNFFEWIDTSDNINPSIYQEKIHNAHILVVGLGGIGSNVCEILARMGVKKFTIIDLDIVDESNLTRQGTYFEKDLNKRKADVLEKYLKKINNKIDIITINSAIESLEELEKFYLSDIDLAVCCADTPKYEIDTWFDLLSERHNIPYVAGSYASTVINTFCINPSSTISNRELYEEHGASSEQLLKKLKVPTSVIAPITYMAAGLIGYKVFTVLTGLNVDNKAVQIDILDWKIYKYDLEKK